MNKNEYNHLNSMMKLERENAQLRLKIKKKDKHIELLKLKIKRLEKLLSNGELDLFEILESQV